MIKTNIHYLIITKMIFKKIQGLKRKARSLGKDRLKKIGGLAGLVASTLTVCGLAYNMFKGNYDVPKIKKPETNLVLVVADDLGYNDLDCYGCPDIPTPNIDSIAENGIKYARGYMCGPMCAPSRAAMLTGRYAQRTGFEFNLPKQAYYHSNRKYVEEGEDSSNTGIHKNEKTIAEFLEKDYRTAWFGKWHVGINEHNRPSKRGFEKTFGFLHGHYPYFLPKTDHLFGKDFGRRKKIDYLTNEFTNHALKFIQESAEKEGPFFLYLPYNAPHTPLQAPEEYIEKFENLQEPRRTYAAMVSCLDDNIGRLLQELREQEVYKNTLVIFTSDNGGAASASCNYPLRKGKSYLYEGGTRVPFIMQWPEKLPAGKVIDTPVSSLDILPTFLAAARVLPPENLDGTNLLRITKNMPENSELFNRTFHWRVGKEWAVTRGNWKAIHTKEDTEFPFPQEGLETYLYNLKTDIGERHNLASENPEVLEGLISLHEKWDEELAKPRWSNEHALEVVSRLREQYEKNPEKDNKIRWKFDR